MSPQGTTLAVGLGVRVAWLDAFSGAPGGSLDLDSAVMDVNFFADGRRLAVLCFDGTFRVIVLQDGFVEQTLRVAEDGHARCFAVHPTEPRVAVGTGRGTIRLLDLRDGEEVLVIAGHRAGLNDLTFSKDGGLLVSVSLDGRIRTWPAPVGVPRGGG